MQESHVFAKLGLHNVIIAVVTILLGFVIAKIATVLLKKSLPKKLNQEQIKLIVKTVYALIIFIFVMSGLQAIGFKFGVLLGAAGIFTLAIGFASQISVSNVISGLFLYFEKPFKVGQTIEINNIRGQVHSIKALSINIQTLDNALVRIPNEALIKNSIINHSHFPTTSFNLNFIVNSEIHTIELMQSLSTLLEQQSYTLPDKPSTVTINNISTQGIQINITYWTTRDNLTVAKNQLYVAVAELLRKEEVKLGLNYQSVQLLDNVKS